MTRPDRKPNRLPDYDYSRNGTYFITVCAKDRQPLFWTVGAATCRPQNPAIGRPDERLSEIGRLVETAILQIPTVYSFVSLDIFCIMPDHIHMILTLHASEPDGRPIAAPTISTIVGSMKRWVSIQAGGSVWQKGFYDHVIRDEQDFLTKAQYIENNPVRLLHP
ncbi:MAG: transposase [Clostridia bacterium]|nr:transposase [Clostridia bacterium]